MDLVWPAQGPPSRNDWRLWDRAISAAIIQGHGTTIRRPLSRWLKIPPYWQWWFDPTSERLYKKNGESFQAHAWLPGHASWTTVMRFRRDPLTKGDLPISAALAMAYEQGPRIILTGYMASILDHSTPAEFMRGHPRCWE